MLSINTNLSSIITQNSMKQSTNKLNEAIERMTTGYKINHAKDNAANYSISTNMTTKIGAYMVAEDNVAMGLNMLTTASESLSQIENKLSRLRALATQASNGTYGGQSKEAINSEANAIVDEVERLYKTAEYNGIKLFESGVDKQVNMPSAGADGFIKTVEKRSTTDLKPLSEVSATADLADDTYSISSAQELAKLAQMTNDGFISEGDTFVLAKDIDLKDYKSGTGWTPIGSRTSPFIGSFDGNGFKITNLVINDTSQGDKGLFGILEQNATLKNLAVVGANVIGKQLVGVLAGGARNNASITIDNCYVSGSISSEGNWTAGLIGQAMGNILNSYSTADVKATSTQVGGLVGRLEKGDIFNSYATGNVRSEGYSCGGLVGYTNENTTIKNCYATGNVLSTATTHAQSGGLVGYFSGGTILDCYATGNVEGVSTWVGGLVGILSTGDTLIENCYATGNVTGDMCIGGLIGGSSSGTMTITSSYATGNVLGNVNVGGFAGYVVNDATAVFENCYTKSAVTGGNGFLGYAGGLTPNVTLRDCSVLGTVGAGKAVFLACYSEGSRNSIVIENCRYNSQLISSSNPLVKNSSDNGDLDITNDTVRGAVTTCGFITPFDFSNDIQVNLQVGIDSSQNSQISMTTSFGLDYLNVARQIGVSDSDLFKAIDYMMDILSAKQTELGAVQNRLDSALDEITTQYDNLVSARSTLRDADMAELSSQYIQQQILQEASATLMGTANQSPAIALQLI